MSVWLMYVNNTDYLYNLTSGMLKVMNLN